MPATFAVANTGNPYTDGVLGDTRWAVSNLTYSFPASASYYGSGYGNGEPGSNFEQLNGAQQAAARAAFAQFAAVANLTFTEITETSLIHANLRLAASDAPSTAWAYTPTTWAEGGDAWFNNSGDNYDAPKKGNYAYTTFIHELGHALGLEHPHQGGNIMPTARDSMEYTVMSYRSYIGSSTSSGYVNETWGYAQTLMMYDIAALQHMYGANYSTNSGNTTYSWSPSTGQLFINGAGQGAPGGNRILMTLWDGGGSDTYDFSNYATALSVDLRPGSWTTTSPQQLARLHYNGSQLAAGNIANALLHEGDTRSLIENAIGGSGDDTIQGNATHNILSGRAGNDHLYGFEGNDTHFGGVGTDWVYFPSDLASYTFQILESAIRVVRDFIDTVLDDVEWFTFNDVTTSYDSLAANWGYHQIENVGDYALASSSGRYVIEATSIEIGVTAGGAWVGPYSFSGWSALQIEENGLGGYQMLWKHASGIYGLWQLDGSGARISDRVVNPAMHEIDFGVDLDGSGTVGFQQIVVETNGDHSLSAVGGQYVVDGSILVRDGSGPAGPDSYEGWSAVQVEEFGSGFQLLWKHVGGSYGLWELNSSGGKITDKVVSPASCETTFEADLDGNGSIGLYETIIESAGDHSLSSDGDRYLIDGTVVASVAGAAVGPSSFAGWSAVQVEEFGSGFQMLWKHTSGIYGIWELNAFGAKLADKVVDPSTYEITFEADIDGNGRVGAAPMMVETVGDHSLSTGGDRYLIDGTVVTKVGGMPVGPSSFAGWGALQVEELGSGFQMLWKHTSGIYGLWEIDASGSKVADRVVDPVAYEITFGVDLDGDRHLGPQAAESHARPIHTDTFVFESGEESSFDEDKIDFAAFVESEASSADDLQDKSAHIGLDGVLLIGDGSLIDVHQSTLSQYDFLIL